MFGILPEEPQQTRLSLQFPKLTTHRALQVNRLPRTMHYRCPIAMPLRCSLSYVWGQSPSATLESVTDYAYQPTLHELPKVIEDSIEVTLRLGFQYLWVDRYCINQSDKEDQHNQIRQMDLIYSNAEFTIIAAAGNGPHHGLPGVRGTLRKYHPCFSFSGRTLIPTLPHARWE